MRKLTYFIALKIAVPIVILTALVLNGCIKPEGEGFAIYLTKGDVSPAKMPALSHVDIAGQPVISMKDIVRYNAQTHELKVTESAFSNISKLDVPVQGRSFLVCVDKYPIYWGAFWTPVSSISFDGVTIWKPYKIEEPYILSFELGYPSSSFYGGEDPRNNQEMMRSLQNAGKLISRLSIEEVDELPRSMKGYELYSWSEDNQWHFTLITGTNRNKTLQEIISNENFISETGWEQIHVVDVDAIKAVLSKLHRDEEIFWLEIPRSEQTPPDYINFAFPPEEIIDNIKEYAIQRGLNFNLQ